MKNKKLFAILTLVCFMFTLMPVAAFAADVTPAYGSIAEEYINVETGDNVVVKVTKSGNYYVYATKDGALFNKMGGTTTGSEIGLSIAKIEGGDSATVTFPVAGEYKIGVAEMKTALVDIIEGTELVAPATVLSNLQTFAIGMINNTVNVEADDDAAYTITLTDGNADLNGDNVKTVIDADNGFSGTVVTATLVENLDGGNTKAVYGAELEITTDSHAVSVTKLDQKTKVDGTMQFRVSATIPGTYHVYVGYENADVKTYTVEVTPNTLSAVEVLAQPSAPVDKGTNLDASGIVFGVSESTGYVFNSTLDTNFYKVTAVEYPAGAFAKTQQFELVYDKGADGVVKGYEIVKAGGDSLAMNKEGKYTFKVSLKNGAAATASVTVQEFDKPVAIKFVKAPTAVVVNKTAIISEGNVIAVDKYGVTKTANTTTHTIDGLALKLSANGAAVDTFTYAAPNYTLKARQDDKYIGTTVSVIAVLGTGTNALTATTEILVTEDAATVKYLNTDVETGKMAKLVADIVDGNGDVVKINYDTLNPNDKVEVIVLDKPANAVVYAQPAFVNDKVVVQFLANEPGEYKIQTVVRYANGASYISGIDTVSVDGIKGDFTDVVVISMGADSMIVNNELVKLDVAPFIENGRTMLQYNVLYVFGIDVDWVKETNSVVAEGKGIKVVMQLGSKVATVNGEEVTLDVAPYAVNGRTVVPVGLITGVFDINYDFTRNADGTIADILFRK